MSGFSTGDSVAGSIDAAQAILRVFFPSRIRSKELKGMELRVKDLVEELGTLYSLLYAQELTDKEGINPDLGFRPLSLSNFLSQPSSFIKRPQTSMKLSKRRCSFLRNKHVAKCGLDYSPPTFPN